MPRINSKNKGSRFERAICKWFQDWTGYEFSRVPASGGLRWKKTDNITSDITCTDPKHSKKFRLSVECKFYHEIKFEHILLGNKGCKILSFWDQACSDADRGNKIPVLIMKYNNMPKDEAFFVVGDNLYDIIMEQEDKLSKPIMRILVDGNIHLNVFMLSDINHLNYKLLSRSLKKL